MVPDPSLTPELIQARAFTAGFRGYDQSEVRDFLTRIAGEVKALRQHAEQLESAWRSAEERAARPPVLDEDTLMAAVGEETAAILRTARAAAAELRARAEAEFENAVSQARDEADRITAEAHELLATETKRAEESAEAVVGAARGEAEEILSRAHADADGIRHNAEQERALTIEGANATREKILEDLTRRRKIATVQIEQLRAGRERLLESYAVVRRTLEEVQEELTRADAEARAAADEAGRRLHEESGPHLRVLPDPGTSDETEAVATDPGPPVTQRGEEDAGAVPAAEAPAAEEPSESPSTPSGANPVDRLFAKIRAGNQSHGKAGKAEAKAVAIGSEPGPGHSVSSEAASAGAAVTVLESAAGDEHASGADSEELAASSEDEPDGEASDEPAPPEASAEADASSAAESSEEEAWLQKREARIVDLEVSLTRKLKRSLQDEQNDLLDRLRSLRGEITAEVLLPDLDAHRARYVRAAQPLVEQAAAGGVAFAGEALGKKPRGASKVPAVGDLAEEAADAIVSPLRRRLEEVITAGRGEEQPALVESLGSAYREWKSQRVERIAGDALSAAFSRGTWNAVPEGTSFRWIAEDVDGPCPDCDDDALAGNLPKGEPFPTGQPYPPAHTGCRCLLIPVAG